MYKILFFSFLLTCFSCAVDAPRQGYLKSDPLISLHFNNYQIKDLEKIMAFFESEICGTPPTTPESAIECYKAYGKALSEKGNFGELDLGLSLKKQEEVFAEIFPVTFNAIWVEKQPDNAISFNTIFGLKYEGQYAIFLKAYGEENEVVKQYASVFEQAGKMTPSMIANVLLNYDQFGLEEQRGRLVLAIHYVTLNRMFAEAD